MSQTKAQLVGGVGISTAQNVVVGSAVTINSTGIDVTGIVTATSFSGDGSNLTNTGSTLSAASGSQRVVVTTQTSGTMTASATDGDLTYDANSDTLNTANLHVTGISTLGSTNGIGKVTIGIGTTALLVEGNARVTGILTVGSSSITFDGVNNTITVGSGVTISASTGLTGSGANLTSLNASNVSSGTLAIARLAVASQAQAEAGTDTATVMTPQRVAQALTALAGGGQVVTTTFTSSGTFTKNADDLFYLVHVIGGGGSNGYRSDYACTGGGGGAGILAFILASSLSTNTSVVVGSGGAAPANGLFETAGNPGGTSSFGNITAFGGDGGGATTQPTNLSSAVGGGIFALNSPQDGGVTRGGYSIGYNDFTYQKNSVYGGGGGASNNGRTGNQAGAGNGTSLFAGNGGSQNNNGTIPGGGSGFSLASIGLSGARGEVRVYAIRKK